MTPLELIGLSASIAAVATVVGAVLLGLFFAKGQPWGTLNDIASIVMMLATIPVAMFLAYFIEGFFPWLVVSAIAGVGIIGMLGASASQALLVLRIRTYEQLLPWTLGFGAVVGVWYVLIAAAGYVAGMSPLPALLALLSGAGYVALGYGFWRGNERHPLSIAGGLVVLVASTAFLGWIAIITVGSGPASA